MRNRNRLMVGVLAVLALGPAGAGCSEQESAKQEKKATATTKATQKKVKDQRNYEVRMNDEEIKNKLTPEQYQVCKMDGTEPPFRNAYWDNHEPGIYVDVISGEPLFSSLDKFDSGSGWPSFTRPVRGEGIKDVKDKSNGMVRTEVRSAESDVHLGHVFDDGPAPTGLRYCINSASLRFVHKNELKEKGYEPYLKLFESESAE